MPVIAFFGELDISTVEEIRPLINSVLEETPGRLVADLAELTFMDSTGIALLLDTSQRVGMLEVRNVSAIVRHVIEIMGLTDTLRIG